MTRSERAHRAAVRRVFARADVAVTVAGWLVYLGALMLLGAAFR